MDKKITNILIACHQHPSTRNAIAIGTDLSRRFQASLHLLLMDANRADADAGQLAAEVKRLGGPAPTIHQAKANNLKELLHCRNELGADIIVMGMEGKGQSGMFQRSAAFKLAGMSDCPVLAVPELPSQPNFNRILVHLDATTETRQKLGMAASLAHVCHSEVHVFGASREKDSESAHYLDVFCTQAQNYFKERGFRTLCSSASGVKLGESVKEYADRVNAGLVVMMTETEPAGLLATPHTEWLMNQQSVPVLTMRPRETMVAGGGL